MIVGRLKLLIHSILSIIRIKNVFIAFLCICIAFNKIDQNIFEYSSLITVAIIILLMMASNIINDIYDIQIDRINRPNRVLVKNPNLTRFFITASIIMIVLSLLLAFLLNTYSLFIIIISIPMLILYSSIFKKIPIIGNLIVASFLALVFIFVEISSLGSFSHLMPEAFIAFSISFIREIIKDVEDYSGDKKLNIKTAPIYFGIKPSINLSCLLIVGFCIQCGYFIQYDYLKYYTLSLIFLIFLPLFYLTYFLIKNPTISSCVDGAKLLKKVTFLGLLIIYII